MDPSGTQRLAENYLAQRGEKHCGSFSYHWVEFASTGQSQLEEHGADHQDAVARHLPNWIHTTEQPAHGNSDACTWAPLRVTCGTGVPWVEVHGDADRRKTHKVILELAVLRHGQWLQDCIRSRLKKIPHGPRAGLDPDDLYQETLLELRRLCVRQPLDLFGPDSSCRKSLACLVRRVITNQMRKSCAVKRDYRRTVGMRAQMARTLAARESATALDRMIRQELYEQHLALLTSAEKQLVQMRLSGFSWVEIAVRLGGAPDAKRMAFFRVIRRIAKPLPVFPRRMNTRPGEKPCSVREGKTI